MKKEKFVLKENVVAAIISNETNPVWYDRNDHTRAHVARKIVDSFPCNVYTGDQLSPSTYINFLIVCRHFRQHDRRNSI